jgi:hypothetical protein
MKLDRRIQIFDDKQIRTFWDSEQEKWFMSITDVIAVLTESIDPNAYWRKLKQRLKVEENETVTNCHSLKMLAADGKMRMTDVADSGSNIQAYSIYSFPQSRVIQTLAGKSSCRTI